MEFRGFGKEKFGKGKTSKIEMLLEVEVDAEKVAAISLTKTAKKLISFTFCLGDFLSCFIGSNDALKVKALLVGCLKGLLGPVPEAGEKIKWVKLYLEHLIWLVNVIHGNVPIFPFHPVISKVMTG